MAYAMTTMNGVDEDIPPDLPRGIALAWGIAEAPQRGPKREMSIERIVEAAMEIADADGITAVSMGGVAARLGFTTMSLYRYVTAKDDLLVLMNEEGIGLPPDHDVIDDDWRTGLQRWLDGAEEHLRGPSVAARHPDHRHPGHAQQSRLARLGPADPAGHLADAGQAVAIVLLLSGMSRWEATITRASAGSEQAGEQLVLRDLVTETRYPGLFAAVVGGAFDPADETDPFVFSTARVLDGVAAYVERAERPRPDDVVEPVAPYQRDQRIKEATQKRREAEGKLRDARKREAELIKSAVEKARREAARGGPGSG